MILCEECKTWQHTPCAGYCTNKDKRIPEKYACYNCTFKGKGKLLRNLQELASFRRAISVVYSEGLESIKWLSRRLGTWPTRLASSIMCLPILTCRMRRGQGVQADPTAGE